MVYDYIFYNQSAISETSSIMLDKKPFAVPKVLYTTLQELRYEDKPKNLWADLLLGTGPEERSKRAPLFHTLP